MSKVILGGSGNATTLAIEAARPACLLWVWLLLVTSCATSSTATFEQHSAELRQYLRETEDISDRESERERDARIEQRYVQLFGAASCEDNRLSATEASALFGSLKTVAFYTKRDEHFDHLYGCFRWLRAHDAVTAAQSEEMYRMLLMARRFSLANELARQHPGKDMNVVPEIVDPVGQRRARPTELVLDPSRHVWARREVQLGPAAQILVIGSPLCHFSQDAARDIAADAVLGPIFRDHATWMTPQSLESEEALIQTWRREIPGRNASLVYREDEWTMLSDWMTPTFYVFRDGVLVSSVRGWPRRGRKDELRAALHRVGLL